MGISLCVFSLTKEKKNTQGNKQVRRTRKVYIFIKKKNKDGQYFKGIFPVGKRKKIKEGEMGGKKGFRRIGPHT